jgi:hypothetical protein
VRPFANPDVPRPSPRRRPPVQPPLVLPVPAPDARRVDAADRLDAIAAAVDDGTLSDAAFRALAAMWTRADDYGVYHGTASALGAALNRDESGRACAGAGARRRTQARRNGHYDCHG